WTLEDLLLFSPQVYWRLFALENESVWPAQPAVLAAVALLALCFIWSRRHAGRWLGPVLGAAWLWTGWQFVALRYGAVNWAAPTFAWGFYAEAALLAGLGLSGRIVFTRQGRSALFGITLLIAAVLVWPVLAPLDGRPWREAEVIVIAPDPTAIATLGLLALAERSRWTALLCVAPVLWLAVSTLTLLTLGAWQGWAVLVALLAGLAAWAAPLVRKPG
ncbi:MAG: DUF6064 family protein, partial [Rhodospirillales bacterium]|nr:DUF6064 family protein [Rhodospirillales bacterium]